MWRLLGFCLSLWVLFSGNLGAQRRPIGWSDTAMTALTWHPGWREEAYADIPTGLFDVVSYYGYALDAKTGGNKEPENLAEFMSGAFAKGVKALGARPFLHVYLDAREVAAFLDSTNLAVQQTAIDSLAFSLKRSGAEGIDLYLPGLRRSEKLAYMRWVARLQRALRELGSSHELWLVLPAYDPEQVYDLTLLQNYASMFVLLANSYHETPSGLRRRPLAPLNPKGQASPQDIRLTLQQYIQGLGRGKTQKLILALPTYGALWTVQGGRTNLSEMLSLADIYEDYLDGGQDRRALRYDTLSSTFVWQLPDPKTGAERFLYFDDSLSLAQKAALVHEYRLGGLGIWMYQYGQTVPAVADFCEAFLGLRPEGSSAPAPAIRSLEVPEDKPAPAPKARPEKQAVLENQGLFLILQFPRNDSLSGEPYQRLETWWQQQRSQPELLLELQDGRRPIHITGLLPMGNSSQIADEEAWRRMEQVALWLERRLGQDWPAKPTRARIILRLETDPESRSVGRVRLQLGAR